MVKTVKLYFQGNDAIANKKGLVNIRNPPAYKQRNFIFMCLCFLPADSGFLGAILEAFGQLFRLNEILLLA